MGKNERRMSVKLVSERMEFLADILATKANECFDNIPEDVQYMIKELDKI